ncbi:putative ABC transport system ATP-binding protein [Lentzea albidocapillata subsp. violacea]|uniref:Putative ABC transport system ATP-binding protein n=1 Tax=Lentzea albidocapillata subsp. violacea TaxID=128104 RepID=A0A1G8PL08_9PSEU|nr:putative ABC transport system ATP-binding protein [Lentzea albidocapillata subsp. violacea]
MRAKLTNTEVQTGKEILRIALRRNRGAMTSGTLLMGSYQAAETAVPILLGVIVEYALRGGQLSSLGLALLALGLVMATVSYSWRFGMRILQKANTTEAHRWRVEVADRGLQPVAREVDLKSGEVLTIATEDADQTADIIEVVPLLVSSLVSVVITGVVLAVISVPLGVLVFAGTAAILSVLSVMSRRIGSNTQVQQAKVARAGAKVSDLIAGLRPLHGFGGSYAAFQAYRRVSTEAKQQSIVVARVNGVYAGSALALNSLLAAAVTLWAGLLTFRGEITIGQLVMVVGLAQFLIEPLKLFSEMPKYVMMARASAERMALVLAAPARMTPGVEEVVSASGLEVSGVTHGTLRDLTFSVQPGEFVAIAAYQPQAAAELAAVLSVEVPPASYSGVVRVGKQEVAALTIASVRTHLLVNPSHHEVFAGTLRDNVDPAGTSTLVDEAVSAAMLTDVVALHSDGLDYAVRDRGANLSGGQRQRLSLARALAANPEILVLHDPTTAVDAVTEQLIARNLTELRRGRTTIVITSSPALLDVADRVIVLDGGTVASEGTHRELLGRDTSYQLAVAR